MESDWVQGRAIILAFIFAAGEGSQGIRNGTVLYLLYLPNQKIGGTVPRA